MKKLVGMILVLVTMATMMAGAVACEEGKAHGTILPKVEGTEGEHLHGYMHVALDETTRELFGITEVGEGLDIYPAKTMPEGTYVRGFGDDDGMIRVKAVTKLIETCEEVFGLTKVEVEVEIFESQRETVRKIDIRRTGETELTTEGIGACTLWMVSEDTTAHIFGRKDQVIVQVGWVWFNIQSKTRAEKVALWAIDFDHDDQLELCFVHGKLAQVKKEETKEEEPEEPAVEEDDKKCKKVVVVTKTVKQEHSSGIDIHIRVGTFVKSVITTCTTIFKMCCKGK